MMFERPLLKSATSPTSLRLRIVAVAGLCGLAAALSAVTSAPQVMGYRSLSPSLRDLKTLSALHMPVSLPTGTELAPPIGNGYSQITVKNGNPVDAVFKLVDAASGETLRFMAVQANDQLTVDDLGTCTCDLRFATGVNWDAEEQRFRYGMAISAFSEPVEFAVKREGNTEYWTTLEVTLHPVVDGNAQTEPLDESEF
ncbi:MAG: hypothetical protein ACHWZW_23770 [Spirulina sp.]